MILLEAGQIEIELSPVENPNPQCINNARNFFIGVWVSYGGVFAKDTVGSWRVGSALSGNVQGRNSAARALRPQYVPIKIVYK